MVFAAVRVIALYEIIQAITYNMNNASHKMYIYIHSPHVEMIILCSYFHSFGQKQYYHIFCKLLGINKYFFLPQFLKLIPQRLFVTQLRL